MKVLKTKLNKRKKMTCKNCGTELTIDNSNTGNSPVLCNTCFKLDEDYDRAEDLEQENTELKEEKEHLTEEIDELKEENKRLDKESE